MGFKNKKLISFVPMELNGETVETIFRRCLATPCEDGLNWKLELDEKKIVKDKTLIRYLLGQLRLVHQGCYKLDYGEDLIWRYCGDIWSENGKHDEQVHMLLELGMKVECLNWRIQDGKMHICLNRNLVFPTFDPKDPAFAGWWDIHEPYFQAQGFFQHRSDKTPEDAQRILDYYRQGTEKGDPWAQKELASAYQDGKFGLSKDPAAAFQLFSFAAKTGDPSSCYKLGICYRDGEGTSQNYEAALQWLCRAIENGADSMAATGLGGMGAALLNKWDDEKDRNLRRQHYKLAKKSLEKAIEALQTFVDEPELDFIPSDFMRFVNGEQLQDFKKLLHIMEELSDT